MDKSYLDFEFNQVVEPKVNLVSCVVDEHKFWLHNNDVSKLALRNYLNSKDTFVTYAAVAECRSFLALDLNPLDFNWIDLFLEYRCLTNHNDKLQWGQQLVDGKVKTFKKPVPKWQRTEEDIATGFKATHSLAEATYKLTGEIRDTAHKNAMRNLIISDPKVFLPAQQEAILKYNAEDVTFLPTMFQAVLDQYKSLLGDRYNEEQLIQEMLWRGRYSAHTAIMEAKGYPIDIKKTKNFSRQVGNILYDLQKEINGYFPKVKPFKWNRLEERFSWNQLATREWIKANLSKEQIKNWIMTDGGKSGKKDLSLSLEAFEKFFSFKHDYPTDNFGAQIVRFLKTKQSLYGFNATTGGHRKSFWDSVGSDGQVRPYLNIYGAQSSRSQPGATGFMFLKPAWMRALVVPPKGEFMAGIDYGSQEFFLSALESKDRNMIEAYLSGDPYLYQGKLAGSIPPEGTKETHGKIRDQFKSTCLAEGSLIRVRCKGYLPIEKILPGMEVWDGKSWRTSGGAVYMGYKQVLPGAISATPDHMILSESGEWIENINYIQSKVHKRKVCQKNGRGFRRPCANWGDVWALANSLRQSCFKKAAALFRMQRRHSGEASALGKLKKGPLYRESAAAPLSNTPLQESAAPLGANISQVLP